MTVVTIGRDAIGVALLVGAPMLLAGMLVGIVISVLQVATSIQDVTITFIPKILAVFFALLISLHWMLRLMIEFTQRIFGLISGLAP
ncbi:MAG: flagellar biosynthetic protein FliQ [Acidobacteria bacterium]|nr:flagellar biosynthetic protein FliQ [Acidobacteriota bacterium]